MWFVGKRGSENGKRAREREKGGTSADIDSDLGNRNEQSQRMFVHNTSFMKDKLWSTKLHSKLMQLSQIVLMKNTF